MIEDFDLWVKSTPRFSTFRVNTLMTTPAEFKEILLKALEQVVHERTVFGIKSELPLLWQHEHIPELIVVAAWGKSGYNCNLCGTEVFVDAACGAAVLRGAQVFAPGVLGVSRGACEGDKVSIYATLSTVCKRGWAQSVKSDDKLFVGTGILLMSRKKLFGKEAQRGIAVRVVDNLYGCPTLDVDFSSSGMALMQNLPSVVCSKVLNPQACNIVLDMCAAPGNKTTHLATLMNNQGMIVALDRSAQRIAKLRELCVNFGVKNVHAFVCDSVTAVKSIKNTADGCEEELDIDFTKGPPFPPNSFDCILLDAPCSGSGQRPRLNSIDYKHCSSFPPLQKKLLETAVMLLKPGGSIVYSTCSILNDENEGIVRWALDHFSNLKLIPAAPRFAPITGDEPKLSVLTANESSCVQKFPPKLIAKDAMYCEEDTIGFFIAKFTKL